MMSSAYLLEESIDQTSVKGIAIESVKTTSM